MPIDPDRLCKCHGEPMLHRTCDGRYRCNIKRRANAHRNEKKSGRSRRRVRLGRNRYIWTAPTVEAALHIRAYIKRRRREFLEQQCRSVETAAPSAS